MCNVCVCVCVCAFACECVRARAPVCACVTRAPLCAQSELAVFLSTRSLASTPHEPARSADSLLRSGQQTLLSDTRMHMACSRLCAAVSHSQANACRASGEQCGAAIDLPRPIATLARRPAHSLLWPDNHPANQLAARPTDRATLKDRVFAPRLSFSPDSAQTS